MILNLGSASVESNLIEDVIHQDVCTWEEEKYANNKSIGKEQEKRQEEKK